MKDDFKWPKGWGFGREVTSYLNKLSSLVWSTFWAPDLVDALQEHRAALDLIATDQAHPESALEPWPLLLNTEARYFFLCGIPMVKICGIHNLQRIVISSKLSSFPTGKTNNCFCFTEKYKWFNFGWLGPISHSLARNLNFSMENTRWLMYS